MSDVVHTPGGDTVALDEPVIPPFREWPKMERYRQLRCIVTEKIDGTNAMIYVPTNTAHPVIAGKRTSWLLNGAKNFGFEAWVSQHAEALRRLGPGTHYGEWYGAGIQRRYGMDGKRFALFAATRWIADDGTSNLPDGLPAELGVVPILYRGVFDPHKVDEVIAKLYREGSAAVPGWRSPEGVVVAVQGSSPWKLSDNGDAKKGRHHHVTAAAGAVDITMSYNVTGVLDGVIAEGFDADNRLVRHVYDPSTDHTAARMDLANRIVTADAAIIDARRAAEKAAQS